MAEWICAKCRSINSEYATRCYSCAAARHEADAGAADLSPPPAPADPPSDAAAAPAPAGSGPVAAGWSPAGDPMAAAPGAYAAEVFAPARQLGPVNLVGGLLAGLAAAVVATIVWYAVVALSGYQVAFVAIAVGWLIGTGVVFGAGGRAAVPLIAASAVFTLLALGISEYLIAFHFASQVFELELIELIQPLDFILEVIIESLLADPVTLVFWGIALVVSVVIPFRSLTAQES